MDEIFEREHPNKPIRSLVESIQSLLGFKTQLKTQLTPSRVELVCHIMKDLQSTKPVDDPLKKSSMFNKTEPEIDESRLKIQGDISALTSCLNQLNLKRRQALNDYLDLKGNIRVFCRIRPFPSDERYVYVRPVVTSNSSKVFLKLAENKSKKYSFDKVFHPQSTQEEVFSEIEPVIKSALDGYNVCIFAYGQTGTGKTYTMEGRPDCPGIVPRGIEALFAQALESNYRFQFTVSMLEIYMNKIRDLLIPRSTKRMVHKAPPLSIQMDPNGGIEIENLVDIRVNDFEQVTRLYKLGSQLRATASTKSNSTSSRSHCLIRISLTCFGARERRRETNKIWMVDLGGSERLLKTQASGRRLEEGKAINLSLSALGDVMSALHGKKPHVPYRNSKLTQVLRDSLGSDSKTIMLVHVSPKEEDMCETICSLGFATRVRSIHLGHEESTEVRARKEIVMAELLQKVKCFESKRQDIIREIERLKHLIRPESPCDGNLEASYLSTELKQRDTASNVRNHRDSTGASTRIPRFMRPTICSQVKIGIDHRILASTRMKPPLPSQQKKSVSVYAESVSSCTKGVVWQSDHGSECSISTTSYTNWKHSADDGTECSQGTSEYEIKEVIFPELEKSPRSLMASLSHGSSNVSEDSQTDKRKSVNNWLHLQMTDQTSTYTQWSKRVLAIPLNKTSLGTEGKEHVNDFRKDLNLIGEIEEYGEEIITGNFKNIAAEETQNSDVSSSTDMRGSSRDSDQKDCKIEVIPEHQQEFNKTTNTAEVGSESPTAQTGAPASKENMMPLDSCSKELSRQHTEDAEITCAISLRSQKSLFLVRGIPILTQRNAASQDSAIPATTFQEGKHKRGINQLFQHTVQMLWATTLIGLGIHSLGFEQDFFNGLMF